VIRKKIIKWISIVSSVCLLLGITGSFALAAKKELTPAEVYHLSKKDKLKYIDENKVIVRTIDLGRLYTAESLPDFGERIRIGDLRTAAKMYSLALFSLEHPGVKFEEGVRATDPSAVMAALAAGTCTSYFYISGAGGPSAWKELGAIADITDLVNNWDQAPHLKKTVPSIWNSLWIDGRCYGIPKVSVDLINIRFRKDWFKEAGIFNKKGEPRPEDNWTYTDLRKIAVKLTDVKKNRWGIAWTPVTWDAAQLAYVISASFGVLEPWGWFIPDKSGKYTWRFGVTPQLIDTYRYLHDLRWKYKCMLSDPASTYPWIVDGDFSSGRVGITRSFATDMFASVVKGTSPFDPKRTLEQDVGWTSLPIGEKTGLRPSTLSSGIFGFNASLSKKEIKAAFDYFDWNYYGKGATIDLMTYRDRYRVLGKEAYPSDLVTRIADIKEIPQGLPKFSDIIPKEYLDLYAKDKMTPAKPQPQQFGLKYTMIGMPGGEMLYTHAFNQKIVSEENLDIKTELEKIANLVNRDVFNYKIEGDKEKFQRYYAAVEKFYKENYPAFYESDMFKETWEKYYKVF